MGFRPPDLREDGCAQMAVHVVGDDVQGEQRVGPDLLDQGRTAGDPRPGGDQFAAFEQVLRHLVVDPRSPSKYTSLPSRRLSLC